MQKADIPVFMLMFWPSSSPPSVYEANETTSDVNKTVEREHHSVSGRHCPYSCYQGGVKHAQGHSGFHSTQLRPFDQSEEISACAVPESRVPGSYCRLPVDESVIAQGKGSQDKNTVFITSVSDEGVSQRVAKTIKETVSISNCCTTSASSVQGNSETADKGSQFKKVLRSYSFLGQGDKIRFRIVD